MKKLLQLNVTANWGSTGKIAEGIGLAAMQRGWESYIAYGRMMNQSQSQLIKVGSQMDVYCHYARHRLFDGEGWGSRRPTLKLVEEIERIQPDIIHLHNIHDHWLNYPIFFKYLETLAVPVVWTFHDCWAFTGGCHYFEMPICDQWKSHCGKCPVRPFWSDKSALQIAKRRELLLPLSGRLTIVSVSQWVEDYCRMSMLCDMNMKMIHNGIDVDTFNVIRPKNDKPLLLGVANVWDYRKGLDDFLKIREMIPIDVADMILVGLSGQQIKKLSHGIKGIERTQDVKELVDLYNRATVLVNPTYADNFPTVNLEALACGTPVITYRTGGSPEAVDDHTGIVVEKGDLIGLRDSILSIVQNRAKYNSSDCRKRAELLFNQNIQYSEYVRLYESLLMNH